MIRSVVFALCTLSVARADECPLPQIAIASTPREDASFDVEYSIERVEGLIAAAERDAERARADRLTVGAEVAALDRDDKDRLAAYEVLSLAIRLRQLDCAVWSGRVATPAPLYRALADDARSLLALLGGTAPPPSIAAGSGWRLPPPKPAKPAKPGERERPINPASRARDYRVGGGIVLGAAAAFVASALALTIEAATFQVPPPCGSTEWLCFNDLE